METVYNEAQDCEYELERKRRIQENNQMIKKIFGEKLISEQRPGRSPTKRSTTKRAANMLTPVLRRNPKRSARSFPTKDEDENEGSDSESTTGTRLMVRWNGPLSKKRRTEPSNNIGEHDVYCNGIDTFFSKNRRKVGSPRVVRAASDFTEEDLLLVADCVSEKHRDSEYGTSCHQCRQKTDDLKSICRSELCIGVRGQFCGPCLKNRYGESVKEALLDPEWSCPPCRNICNCSFCMVKRGRRCTGQMIGLARENGYHDVRSFLGD